MYERYEIEHRCLWWKHIVTYLGVCVTYRLVLDWWPDLLHTYGTCYHTSQTTLWHTVPSFLHHLRLPPQEILNSIPAAWDPRHIALGRPQKENTVSQQFIYCHRAVFTSSLHRNGSSSIVACVFISAGTCLPSRCPVMNVCSGSGFQASCHSIFFECWLTSAVINAYGYYALLPMM
jgi:hypothetical protein